MSPAEALVERTTAAQGLPITVTDPATVAVVASVLTTARRSENPGTTPGSIATTSSTVLTVTAPQTGRRCG
ncbi:MAG: hypothetical protein ACR2MN_14920 [Acidimicrobiales bacterium]